MTVDITHPTLFDLEAVPSGGGRRIRRFRTRVDDHHKVCVECRTVKHVDDYSPNANGALGRQASCRACVATAARNVRKGQSPDERKDRSLREMWGITLEEYRQMADDQNGVCAICHHPETEVDSRSGKVRDLAIDHNHLTGEIRGLLCDRCNRGLGFLGDNPDLLIEAALYLERVGHSARRARRSRPGPARDRHRR